jgi:hypothetical protein
VKGIRRTLIHLTTEGELVDGDEMPEWYPLVRSVHDANAGTPPPAILPWALVAEPWGTNGRLLKAARYLGVPVADLAEQASWWVDMALLADQAEREAEEALRKGSQPIAGFPAAGG